LTVTTKKNHYNPTIQKTQGIDVNNRSSTNKREISSKKKWEINFNTVGTRKYGASSYLPRFSGWHVNPVSSVIDSCYHQGFRRQSHADPTFALLQPEFLPDKKRKKYTLENFSIDQTFKF